MSVLSEGEVKRDDGYADCGQGEKGCYGQFA